LTLPRRGGLSGLNCLAPTGGVSEHSHSLLPVPLSLLAVPLVPEASGEAGVGLLLTGFDHNLWGILQIKEPQS
jgi:hypothetical protein